MSKPLMTIVLPRLARPLYRQLERYWGGELTDRQFTRRFEALLNRQHNWLAERGISDVRAALAIHAALIVLSMSGLRSEAESEGVPLEVIENRAVQEAAEDIEQNYEVNRRRAADVIARVVVKYAK
jgi:hypothetical protein